METSQLINRTLYSTPDRSQRKKVDYMSDSMFNDYVPFYSAFHGDFKKIGDVRFNMFSLLKASVIVYSSVRVANFKEAFGNYVVPLRYTRENNEYNVGKQYITAIDGESQTFLYCLAIKSDYLFGSEPINMANLDYSKLIMLVDRRFEAVERRLMYNFVKREIINPQLSLGIDLVMTNDIRKWCFKSSESPMQFATMSHRREYFHNFTNTLIDGLTGRERNREIAAPEPARSPHNYGSAIDIQLSEPVQQPTVPHIQPELSDEARETIARLAREHQLLNDLVGISNSGNTIVTNNVSGTTDSIYYSAGVDPFRATSNNTVPSDFTMPSDFTITRRQDGAELTTVTVEPRRPTPAYWETGGVAPGAGINITSEPDHVTTGVSELGDDESEYGEDFDDDDDDFDTPY